MLIFIILSFLLWTSFSTREDKSDHKIRHKPVQKLPEVNYIDLNGVVMGKSKTLDYRSNRYTFFAFNKGDVFVSQTMVRNNGVWESFLHDLFNHLILERTRKMHEYALTVTHTNTTGTHSRDDLVVIDIGANIGAFTLYAASFGCQVYSFEMQPDCLNLLDVSLRISGYRPHVHLYNVPLWDSVIEISYTPDKNNFGATYVALAGEGGVKANTSRLDSLISVDGNIFFLKVDIEGKEEFALRGYDTVINKQRVENIVIGDTGKVHLPIYKWLFSLGYSCRPYGPVDKRIRANGYQNCSGVLFSGNCLFSDIDGFDVAMASFSNVHCRLPNMNQKSVRRKSVY